MGSTPNSFILSLNTLVLRNIDYSVGNIYTGQTRGGDRTVLTKTHLRTAKTIELERLKARIEAELEERREQEQQQRKQRQEPGAKSAYSSPRRMVTISGSTVSAATRSAASAVRAAKGMTTSTGTTIETARTELSI